MEVVSVINVLTQTGAFGLLVYMIVFGVPAWVRDFRSEQKEQRDEQSLQRGSEDKRIEMVVNAFKEEIAHERESCREQAREANMRADRILEEVAKQGADIVKLFERLKKDSHPRERGGYGPGEH